MFLLRLIWAVVHALFAKRADLVAENLALRQQLIVADMIAYRARRVISIADFLLRYRVEHSPRTLGGNHWPSGWSIWYGHVRSEPGRPASRRQRANELPAREAYYPQAAPTWPLQENVTVPTLTQGLGSLHC